VWGTRWCVCGGSLALHDFDFLSYLSSSTPWPPVLKYHPDHNQKGEWDSAALGERTRLIIEAHKTLRNAAKRAEYDRGRFF
jgi:hypothetical protein